MVANDEDNAFLFVGRSHLVEVAFGGDPWLTTSDCD